MLSIEAKNWKVVKLYFLKQAEENQYFVSILS